jgi:MFS family permease
VDRLGERVVLTTGAALTAAAAFLAAPMPSAVAIGALLFASGMGAVSCDIAGGRLVSGWFPHRRRGLTIGIRQTAEPLGLAIGAVAVPELTAMENGSIAGHHWSIPSASALVVCDPTTGRPRCDQRTDQLRDGPHARLRCGGGDGVGLQRFRAVAITEIGGPFWSGRAPTMAERRVSMWATSIKVDD